MVDVQGLILNMRAIFQKRAIYSEKGQNKRKAEQKQRKTEKMERFFKLFEKYNHFGATIAPKNGLEQGMMQIIDLGSLYSLDHEKKNSY